jgi:acetylornithine deacetylase
MQEIIDLLKSLISVPSFSKEEEKAAEIIRGFLAGKNIPFHIKINNTWAYNRHFSKGKPVILLNSHIDTVRPVSGWTTDPFVPTEDEDRIIGLGSNDAGGPLVALLGVFLHFYDVEDLPFNLIYSATAEEENSGINGLELTLSELPAIDFVIVGEPTRMEVAVAEKGLMVLDCIARGKSGHAARDEGINALYLALEDIQILREIKLEKKSSILGEVKITVTQIEAGTQHNVVPDTCKFVVDVRTNEYYSNQDVYNIIRNIISSEVRPRSFRLNSSGTSLNHPFIRKARKLGIHCFGSPTTSDQAVIPYPSVKMGPGDSARSHTANEYICKKEIMEGVARYIQLLDGLEL